MQHCLMLNMPNIEFEFRRSWKSWQLLNKNKCPWLYFHYLWDVDVWQDDRGMHTLHKICHLSSVLFS